MKHLVAPFLFFLIVSTARADLSAEIRALLAEKPLAKAAVGVQVVRLGADPANCAVLFAHNPTTALAPASNMKLITTSAALRRLGGDFRFRTILYLRGEDLLVVGDGDPTIGDAELLKPHGQKTTTLFESWAELLKSRGVTQISNVLIDDSIFDADFAHPDWPGEDLHKRYGAQVGGLNFNGNCVDFYLSTGGRGTVVTYRLDPPTRYVDVSNGCLSGTKNAVWLTRKPGGNDVILKGETNASNVDPISVTVHDPGMCFATVFAETLQKAGIRVEGRVQRATSGDAADAVALAAHETPIEVVLRRANKDSVNLYADALLKRLARESSGQPGSFAGGREVLSAFLQSCGAQTGEFSIDDGSGLSPGNRVSANALTRVLLSDFYGPHRQMMLDSLAVGGADGTLQRRFTNDLRGRVYAKTGYIGGVRALSGFLRGRSGNWYAFSVLMNGQLNSEARQTIDKIIAALDRND